MEYIFDHFVEATLALSPNKMTLSPGGNLKYNLWLSGIYRSRHFFTFLFPKRYLAYMSAVEVIDIDPKISGALLIPVTVIISYFGHSRFSFRSR